VPNTKNVPTTSVKPEQNWLTTVLSVLFSAKNKRREKIGVSNGMKPRTQILDKTQKRSESEQVEWASTRFIQACVVQAHEWGGGTSRVKQPCKQQKGWPF